MSDKTYELGMVGLGTMGRNFLLNVGDHGFSAAGYDPNESQRNLLEQSIGDRNLRTVDSIKDLLKVLSSPRAVMLLVPAGKVVDDVLKELTGVCDYVVVDAPPILLVSDALEVAKKVDGVILVARMRATRLDEARLTRQSLERIGVKPLGVVLSGVAKAKTYYRRYGGYYSGA